MQTNFTPEQLRDPAIATANGILRRCVHCGFCTATCPTYQVLGDELDSPRGRIYLIKDMLESGRAADAKTALHVDRCLSCLACVTTCPSGVNYMHLIDHARVHVERTYGRPWHDRALRSLLAAIIPHPRRFRLALMGAKLARPFARLIPDKRLRAMLAITPKHIAGPTRDDLGATYAPTAPRRARVALLTGCAQKALDTDINDATIRLLRRAGCEVVIPENLGCCGALTHHMGKEPQAMATARAAIHAFLAADAAGPLDAIIVNASGCGTTVKDYGHMFAHDPDRAGAERVASLARDITEFLAAHGLPPVTRAGGAAAGSAPAAPDALRVAYHAACSLQHGQKIVTAPKTLLAEAGFQVMTPADSHLCCGSAGTYNLLQPELSAELRTRKVRTIEALGPQVVAAGNIGCMMQIGSGTAVPVVHTVQLLDWATGGPCPPALEDAGT